MRLSCQHAALHPGAGTQLPQTFDLGRRIVCQDLSVGQGTQHHELSVARQHGSLRSSELLFARRPSDILLAACRDACPQVLVSARLHTGMPL